MSLEYNTVGGGVTLFHTARQVCGMKPGATRGSETVGLSGPAAGRARLRAYGAIGARRAPSRVLRRHGPRGAIAAAIGTRGAPSGVPLRPGDSLRRVGVQRERRRTRHGTLAARCNGAGGRRGTKNPPGREPRTGGLEQTKGIASSQVSRTVRLRERASSRIWTP